MNALTKGIAVALAHILIVLSLGGKLFYDRATRPRVWVKTAIVYPDLPIRGRYLFLGLQVRMPAYNPGPPSKNPAQYSSVMEYVQLTVENGQLVARKSESPTNLYVSQWNRRPNSDGSEMLVLSPNVDFFLPEHAEMPRMNPNASDELWVEVTVPRKGPPRPIQLAMKRGGQWIPLTYR